mmetsp:Transcript_5859/g.17735  ORF Transcript_5859/g.17735 Transcript_5859/m.17735 type:complete len:348 (+) Transcript_5859:7106-8149(+)
MSASLQPPCPRNGNSCWRRTHGPHTNTVTSTLSRTRRRPTAPTRLGRPSTCPGRKVLAKKTSSLNYSRINKSYSKWSDKCKKKTRKRRRRRAAGWPSARYSCWPSPPSVTTCTIATIRKLLRSRWLRDSRRGTTPPGPTTTPSTSRLTKRTKKTRTPSKGTSRSTSSSRSKRRRRDPPAAHWSSATCPSRPPTRAASRCRPGRTPRRNRQRARRRRPTTRPAFSRCRGRATPPGRRRTRCARPSRRSRPCSTSVSAAATPRWWSSRTPPARAPPRRHTTGRGGPRPPSPPRPPLISRRRRPRRARCDGLLISSLDSPRCIATVHRQTATPFPHQLPLHPGRPRCSIP